jgi:hypothetical protein
LKPSFLVHPNNKFGSQVAISGKTMHTPKTTNFTETKGTMDL